MILSFYRLQRVSRQWLGEGKSRQNQADVLSWGDRAETGGDHGPQSLQSRLRELHREITRRSAQNPLKYSVTSIGDTRVGVCGQNHPKCLEGTMSCSPKAGNKACGHAPLPLAPPTALMQGWNLTVSSSRLWPQG